jgi:hypothetical protein
MPVSIRILLMNPSGIVPEIRAEVDFEIKMGSQFLLSLAEKVLQQPTLSQ